MTDLERAQSILRSFEPALHPATSYATREMLVESIAHSLAVARREGEHAAILAQDEIAEMTYQRGLREGAEAERAMWEEGIAQVQHDAYDRGAEAEKVNITALAEEAYSHGVEEMRERAAKFVEWWLRPDEARYLAQDIRALPLTPEDPQA